MRASRRLAAALVPLLCVAGIAASAHATPAGQSTVKVGQLTTEYAHNPLGIDVARPRLSWQLSSPDREQNQTAYQILVASSPAVLAQSQGDVWDSGKVSSGQSVNVQYGGPDLASRTRYYWEVRVWDSQGVPSAWSPPAWWETALLNPGEWTADWIGPPATDLTPDLDGADWMWYPEGNPAQSACIACTRYFRLDFAVPSDRTVASATLTTSADNQVTAYLNGNQVAASSDWTKAARQDVTAALTPGANVLALAGFNINGPGGLIARLRINFTSGDPMVIDSGAGAKANNTEIVGWQTVGFDDSAWPAALDLGVYGISPWKTGITVAPAATVNAPLLRKEFTATGAITRARAYITGLGNYTLNINGQKIGDRLLDPAYTEYEKTVLYAIYDVTSDLHTGQNAIAVELAPGFYYYNTPKLLMQLVIDYADGTSTTISSDNTWQLDNSGPTSFAAAGGASGQPVFGGESYDARRNPAGWDQPGFDATGWQQASVLPAPGGRLVAETEDPITVAGDVTPTAVTQLKSGDYVVDMGQMITGWVKLTAAGHPGEQVSMQYGEKLNADGSVNSVPSPGPRSRFQRDDYTFATSGTESWEPSFTFKSFRYVQLHGLDAAPQAGTVIGRLVHTSVANTGSFASSNALYNQIHDAMQRTVLNGLLGFPAIDPANERNGWTGDTQLIAPSETDNFGMDAFLAQWLNDIQDGQRADGSISDIDPIRDGCCYGWAPEWDAAYPLVSWDLYVRYGDLNVLASHYDSLTRYMQWQLGSLKDGISPAGPFGDWNSPGYSTAPEDRRLSATAYMYHETEVMADIAAALGHNDDAANYRSTADFIKTQFNALFLNTTTGQYQTTTDPGYRQANNAIPLEFGMVPEEYRVSVLQSLVDDVEARGGHLNTGILATPAVLDVLTNNGYADLAQTIANQTTYPSWGQWVQAGADTMWEAWGLGGRSRNHPMFGTVDAWFYEDVAGISPDPQHPGYQNSIIKPHPMTAPSQASASIDTAYGQIAAAWSADTTTFALNVQVPGNATATVDVPIANCSVVTEGGQPADQVPGITALGIADGYAQFNVGSGNYHFRCGQ
jgi:alpha-L-rhamnosidase